MTTVTTRAACYTLVALLCGFPAALQAQDISARAVDIRVGGRLHAQFQSSSLSDDAQRDFFLRRARVTLDMSVTDRVDGRVMADFAGGGAAVQDAYFRVRLAPGLHIAVGQFKRSFDLFELESSTQLAVVERDGRIAGLSACEGVGGTCSYSRLTEKLGYAGRDAGVRIDGSLGERASYQISVTNGEGVNTRDINNNKSFAGRVAVDVADGVVVGVNTGFHDYLDDAGDAEFGNAFGLDLMFGDYGGGPILQAAFARGDNWEAPDDSGSPGTFQAAQVIGSYYAPVENSDLLEGVEPLLRISTADPTDDLDDDGGLLFTPGVNAYFRGRNRVGVNLDVYNPSMGDAEWSFKFMTYLYF